MLADIESVQMQAEGAHLEDERIDECAGDANAAVGRERCAEGFDIVEELLRGAIGGQRLGELLVLARKREGRYRQRRAARVRMAGLAERALDAGFEADGEAPIVLELVLRAE